MNYPLISEYIEAIKYAEDNFATLTNLRPVFDDDGNPIMSCGNFAVVFKMIDEQTGKMCAVKCFLREQEGRDEAYRMISEDLEFVSSTYLTPIKYLKGELFVNTSTSTEAEFPVLIMDWVEGMTLDKYIRKHINDKYELSMLAYQFSRLAMWLMPQPFAHGDLKPDNIIVKNDGTLVLVDYDGMFVPAMKGQKSRELGSPDFRHPNRTEFDFDEHIDDFSIANILLSLKAISLRPSLLKKYGASDCLLFTKKDYQNISQCALLNELYPSDNSELNILLSLFTITFEKSRLSHVSFRLFNLNKPQKTNYFNGEMDLWVNSQTSIDIEAPLYFDEFIKRFMIAKYVNISAYNPFTDCEEDAICFIKNNGEELIVYNQIEQPSENLEQYKGVLKIGCDTSGRLFIYGYSSKVSDNDFHTAYTDAKGIMYSENKKRLIGVYNSYLPEYEIAEGTEVICDDALNGFWHEIEGLSINGKLTIPSSVRYIGRNPFRGDYGSIICKSHHFVVEDNALFTSNRKCLISCFSKESVFVIPDCVEQIGAFAFYGCDIDRIIIPESISYIGDNPFLEMNVFNDHSLEVICKSPHFFVKDNALYQRSPQKIISYWGKSQTFYLEEQTISIRPYSFFDGISRLYMPNSIKDIATEAFYGYGPKLQQLYIPINCTNKFSHLLPKYKNQLVEVDLSKEWFDEFGVKYSADRKQIIKAPYDIEEYAIKYNTKLICEGAFLRCERLKKVVIPSSVKSIGDYSFCACKRLSTIIIHNSVEDIGKCAFKDCVSLKEIIIPDSVVKIGNSAFSECRSLERIILPNSLKEFDGSKFLGCNNLSQIIIPNGTRNKFEKLLPGYGDEIVEQKDIEQYSEEPNSSDMEDGWTDEYGAIYSSDRKMLLKGPNIPSYTIIEGTIVICERAFSLNYSISNISIPNSVIQIGESAFWCCKNLKNVTIPNSLRIIKESTFEYCHALTIVKIPESVSEIHKNAFSQCVNLERIIFPKSLHRIGYQAFSGCKSLTKAIIPATVANIDTFAFAGCHSLVSIEFLGTPILGNAIFTACINLKSIFIPHGTMEYFKTILDAKNHDIIVESLT